MVNTKKYKNRYVTTLPFEKENFDRLNQLLPKGVTIADEINKFIEERRQELEKEKNRDVSLVVEASPITSLTYKGSEELTRDNRLNEFIKVYEDDLKRMKSIKNMTPQELYKYATFLHEHLTEVMTIRWKKYKLPSMFKGIYINPKLLDKFRISE